MTMTDDTTFIYGLVDPRDGRMRYVGKANDPEKRLFQHVHEKGDSHKRRWIEVLNRVSLCPRLVYLAKVEKAKWKEAEKFQIAFFRGRDMADLNKTDGGDGLIGYKVTDEHRRKNSEAQKGNQSALGYKNTDAQRKNKSSAFRGRVLKTRGQKHTIEHRRHQSEAQKGRPQGEEHRRHNSESHKGKTHTDETRHKMSLAHMGMKQSEETCCKKREANKGKMPWSKGKHHTDASRIKMSVAQKLRWAIQKRKETIYEK